MKTLDALLESLTYRDTPVRQVCTGAFWTLVTSRFSAVAATYRDLDLQHSDDPQVVPDAGELTKKTAGELATYARLQETVAASIGLAAINSLIEVAMNRCTQESAFDILAQQGAGRRIVVVGHFPFISRLREIAQTVWVIEKRLRPGDLHSEEAARVLPKAEVVCLSGTTLINKTLDDLLEACRGSYVVLTGPSSPMSPVLFEFGISAICGTRVTDAETVVRYITQGACFRQLRGHGIQLLTLRKD